MNHIICPIDFSGSSLNALSFAVKVAAGHGASLILYHAFSESSVSRNWGQMRDIPFKTKMTIAKDRLNELCEEINESADGHKLRKCTSHLEIGKFPDNLVQMVQDANISAIVVALKKNKTNARFHVAGSIMKIIDKVSCKVFIVPKNTTFTGFDKIVYATDFQKSDKQVLQEVVALAVVFASRIKVLHISSNEQEKKQEKISVKNLKSFVQYDKIDFVSKPKVGGDIGECIQDFLQKEEASLLTLLTKHRNFLDNLFHFSMIKNIPNKSECPILIVKSN